MVIELGMVGTRIKYSSSCVSLCVSWNSTPDIVCHGFGWVDKPKWFFKDYMEDDGCRKM